MKKISTLFFISLLVICMVSCKGGDNDNVVTLVKHWTGEKTDIRFDVVGNIMTPDEFSEYLKTSIFSSRLKPYMSYINMLSSTEITDFTFKKDGTYDLSVKTSRSEKTVSGEWMQVNDRVTIFIDLSQVYDLEEAGNWDLTIVQLTAKQLHLSGKLDFVEGSMAALVDFYGKR